MKIIVVLVAVVLATICWTGVTAQDDFNVTEFQAQFANLNSTTVEQMMGDLEDAGGSNNTAGFNPQTRSFFTPPLRRCENGPFLRVVRVPGIFYWPPIRVFRCGGSCPNRSPCIARKRVTRVVRTAVYKRFIVNGKPVWIFISVRFICVKDETCCECKQCSDITKYSECRRTAPCPDTTNRNTFCFWKRDGGRGSCACCKRTLCEPDKAFDKNRCQCRCKRISCKGRFVQDPDTCKCVCPHKDINCGPNKFLDFKTCKCKCKPFWCKLPQLRNFNTCKCVCPWIRCSPGSVPDPRTCRRCIRPGFKG